MVRKTFDRELNDLQHEVLALGRMVENAIVQSVATLKHTDHEAARRLIDADGEINEKRFIIEGDALTLIATQQPLASDLRKIFTAVLVATELERIADYAKGIAKVTLMMGAQPLLDPFAHIPRMLDLADDMLHRALEAYALEDASLAHAIPDEDEEMDGLHNRVYRELLTVITADPSTTDRATYLLWVAHNLERAADRVVNICERVVFTVTGEIAEMDVEEGEDLGLEALS